MDLYKLNLIVKTKKSSRSYTTQPTAQIDLARFYVDQRPDCYIKIDKNKSEEKLKKIVIHDGTLKSLSPISADLLNELVVTLEELYEQEVDVFVWTGSLEKITDESKIIEILERAEFGDLDRVQQEINKLGISADELMLLDYHRLRSFIYAAANEKNFEDYAKRHMALMLSEIVDLPKEELRSLIDACEKSAEPLTLELDLPLPNDQRFLEVLEACKQIKINIPSMATPHLEQWVHYISNKLAQSVISINDLAEQNDDPQPQNYTLICRLIQALPKLMAIGIRLEGFECEEDIEPLDFSSQTDLKVLRISSEFFGQKQSSSDLSYISKLIQKIPSSVEYLELPIHEYLLSHIKEILERLTRLKYIGEADVVDERIDWGTTIECDIEYEMPKDRHLECYYYDDEINFFSADDNVTFLTNSRIALEFFSSELYLRSYATITKRSDRLVLHKYQLANINLSIKCEKEIKTDKLYKFLRRLSNVKFLNFNFYHGLRILGQVERAQFANVKILRLRFSWGNNKPNENQDIISREKLEFISKWFPNVERVDFVFDRDVHLDADIETLIVNYVRSLGNVRYVTTNVGLGDAYLLPLDVVYMSFDPRGDDDCVKEEMVDQNQVDTVNDLNLSTFDEEVPVVSAKKKIWPKYGKDVRVELYRNLILLSDGDCYDDIKTIDISLYWSSDICLRDRYKSLYADNPSVYLAEDNFEPPQQEWMPLPSLSPNDEIINIQANQLIDLGYSKEKNLYYVRVRCISDQSLKIKYIFQAKGYCLLPNQLIEPSLWQVDLFRQTKLTDDDVFHHPNLSNLNNNEKLGLVVHYCSQFSAKRLDGVSEDESISMRIFREQAGHCSHRSRIAVRLLNAWGINARLVCNDVHEFIEVNVANQWCAIDLGGSPAEIEYTNSPLEEFEDLADLPPSYAMDLLEETLFGIPECNPFDAICELENSSEVKQDLQVQQKQVELLVPQESNRFLHPIEILKPNDIEDVFLNLESWRAKLPRKQMLYVVPDWNGINEFYAQLGQIWREVCGRDIEVVADLADIEKTIPVVSNNKIERISSPFYKYIHTDPVAGLLCINLLNGSADDQLYDAVEASIVNPLFDHRRTVAGMKIPDDIYMLAVISKSQFDKMGEDFQSRFPVIYRLDGFEFLRKHNNQVAIKANAEAGFVDVVCSGHYTIPQLCGSFLLNGSEFAYQSGELERHLRQGNSLFNFINPPIEDPEFQSLLRRAQVKAEIIFNGRLITIPTGFKYKLSIAPLNMPPIVALDNSTKIDLIINTTNLNDFIDGPIQIIDGRMVRAPSLFSAYAYKQLTVMVANDVEDAEVRMLFVAASKFGIEIEFVNDERDFDSLHTVSEIDQQHLANYLLPQARHFILSNNPDRYAAKHHHAFDLVISINEFMSAGELFGEIKILDNGDSFDFEHSAIGLALMNKQRVLLYGDLNYDVYMRLESLKSIQPYIVINGERIDISRSQLMVCVDLANEFLFACGDIEYFSPNDDLDVSVAPLPAQKADDQSRVFLVQGEDDGNYIQSLLESNPGSYLGLAAVDQWLVQPGFLVLTDFQHACLRELQLLQQLLHARDVLYWNKRCIPLHPEHKIIIHIPTNLDNEISSILPAYLPVHNLPIFDFQKNGLDHIAQIFKNLELNVSVDCIQRLFEIISTYADSVTKVQCGHYALRFYFLYQNLIAYSQSESVERQMTALQVFEYLICDTSCAENKKINSLIDSLLAGKLSSLYHKLLPAQKKPAYFIVEMLELLQLGRENPVLSQYIASGLLLEGAPGIGKTWLMQQIMSIYGFAHVQSPVDAIHSDMCYVDLPPDNILAAKELFQLAVERRWLVFFDEMNTISEEERSYQQRDFMADVISGLRQNQSVRGHFAIVATQNPTSSFTGRRVMPSAINNQFMSISLRGFGCDDLIALGEQHRHPETVNLAKEYGYALSSYKSRCGFFRQPTIRQFIDVLKTSAASASIDDELADTQEHAKRRKLN